MDGKTFCGDRVYQIMNQESLSSFIEITDNVITVQALEEAQIGEHEVQLKAHLKDYSSQMITNAFKVTVNPCKVEEFVQAAGPSKDSEYKIRTPKKSLGLFTLSQQPCSYIPTFKVSSTRLANAISVNAETGEVFVETEDQELEGIHEVVVTAQITVPQDWEQNSFEDVEAQYEFQLTLLKG